MSIVSQNDEEVKECDYDGCHELIFRKGLCWHHFKEEINAEWDAQAAEREAVLAGVGYIFNTPALYGGWWGDPVEEVCR